MTDIIVGQYTRAVIASIRAVISRQLKDVAAIPNLRFRRRIDGQLISDEEFLAGNVA